MTRIEKQTDFFRRNHHYIFGGLWFLIGVVMMFLQDGVVYYLYMPLGLGIIVYGFLNRNKTEEFISFNAEKIEVKQLGAEPITYPLAEVDSIFISNNHLTIKCGAANGIILDLKGYSQRDIQLLETYIGGVTSGIGQKGF